MGAIDPPARILVVEDDPDIRSLVARYLSANGLRVTTSENASQADRALADANINLVVLDLNLPGEDGLSLCRRLRGGGSRVPIVMLTARTEEIDRIIGLEMGADDYLAKPFSPRELLARIKAVLRRTDPELGDDNPRSRGFLFEGWKIDLGLRAVFEPQGARVALTTAEFELLRALCEHPGRVLSRDQLLDLTQGKIAPSQGRSVDILVSRLRHKIEQDPKDPKIIKTVRSGGYFFTASVERVQ
jgi:two-component system, OmpR family, response regulator